MNEVIWVKSLTNAVCAILQPRVTLHLETIRKPTLGKKLRDADFVIIRKKLSDVVFNLTPQHDVVIYTELIESLQTCFSLFLSALIAIVISNVRSTIYGIKVTYDKTCPHIICRFSILILLSIFFRCVLASL